MTVTPLWARAWASQEYVVRTAARDRECLLHPGPIIASTAHDCSSRAITWGNSSPGAMSETSMNNRGPSRRSRSASSRPACPLLSDLR